MELDFSQRDNRGRRATTTCIAQDEVEIYLNPKWTGDTANKQPSFIVNAKNKVGFLGTGATWRLIIKEKKKHEGKYSTVQGVRFNLDIKHIRDWVFDLQFESFEEISPCDKNL